MHLIGGIEVEVDSPQVGQNLVDHTLTFTAWKLKNPEDGWSMGSNNVLFTQPQYTWGAPTDFIVTTTIPKEGLARAIEADEGVKPDPSSHPLLARDHPFLEFLMLYTGAPDGSTAIFTTVDLLPTSRGLVTLDPANPKGTPLINPNYLSTEVDRHVHRELFRKLAEFACSDKTTIGRDILDGEIVPPGVEPLSPASTDDALDRRARSGIG
jgi:choline dehydrogenase